MKRSLRIVVSLAFAVNVTAAVILVGGGLLSTPTDAAPAGTPRPSAPAAQTLPSAAAAPPPVAAPAAEPSPSSGAQGPSAAPADPAVAAPPGSGAVVPAAASADGVPSIESTPAAGAAAPVPAALPAALATDDAFDRLKRAYENMEPETAAKAVRELASRDRGAVVALLLAFNARTAGAILDGLTTSDPALAADLSYEIWKRSGKSSPPATAGNSR